MTQSPITVTYDIKELFDNLQKNINDRFDKLEEKVNKIELEQGKMAVKIEKIETDITELKGSQNKQVWALVGIIAGAVLSGIVIAIWRTAIMGKA